jgi:hypothetical protein
MEDDANLYQELLMWARKCGGATAPVRITLLTGTENRTFRVESNFRKEGRNGYTTSTGNLFLELYGVNVQLVITISI